MRKIYLLACTALLSTAISAQQTMKIRLKPSSSNETKNGEVRSKMVSKTRGVMALAGSIVCLTKYAPSTTMNLNLTLTLTNSDGEYGDSLAITFPAGITPISSPNDPFAPITDNGTGQTPEALNGVNGQIISWGNNDNVYGGIEALGNTSYNFTVNVAIGAISGLQTANFHLSGDTYGSAPANLNGTIAIHQEMPADMQALAVTVPYGCSLGSEQVTFLMKNSGTAPATGFGVSYISNGSSPVVETYTGTITPGDTVAYTFTTLLNMTTAGNYNLNAFTAITGDADITNDTASYMSASISPTSLPYSTGFESTPATDLAGWTVEDADSSGYTWALNATAHAGTNSLRAYENDVNGASNDWLFSTCMNFTASTNYRITYWKRLTTGYFGSLGISLGSTATTSGMTQVLSALSPLTANSLWAKDSANFTVPTTGVYYIGFDAVNTDDSSSVAIRLDDINIKIITPAGINEEEIGTLSVYPSPSTGIFNINVYNQNTQLEVFNLLGEKIYSASQLNKGINSIDLTNVPQGNYFVKIISGNKVATQKVILNK